MKTKKLLTTVVVFAVVLAAMSTVIEAQRGGGQGGGGGGGGHWSVNAGSDNNVGDNNNAGDNAGYTGDDVGYIEVYVSTDKRRYVLNEPIEITVTAYNPTGSTITLGFPTGPPQNVGCQAIYSIDGIYPGWGCDTAVTYANVPPRGSVSWQFTQPAEYGFQDPDFQVTEGRHTIVGMLRLLGSRPQSRPITIRVVEPNNGGM